MTSMIKDFKKPDLNAPRARSEYHNIVDKEFINRFKEKYPVYKDVDNSVIKEIIFKSNGFLWDHVLHNRDGVELPERLGHIFIGTCMRAKKLNVNYGASIQSNTRLRHRNFESDNYLAKIFYTNYSNKYNFKTKTLWDFVGVREFKRAVAKVYPEKWKIYLQVESKKHISKYLKQIRKQDWSKKYKETFVIDPLYNEFNLT